MNVPPSPQNKRTDSRLDVAWTAELILDGATYPCKLSNISTAGALLHCDQDLALKQEVILHIPDFGDAAGIVTRVDGKQYGLKLLAGDNLKLKDYADNVGLDNRR